MMIVMIMMTMMQSHNGCICLFKCLLKANASEDASSDWLHLLRLFTICLPLKSHIMQRANNDKKCFQGGPVDFVLPAS